MTTGVQTATREDLAWLASHDHHVSTAWVARCVELGEYLVARQDGEIAGFLRFSRFWGRIPYMDMISVVENRRRQGVGTALFTTWQAAMAAQGASVLVTSSVGSELEPQAWHRRNGFAPSGRLTFGKFQPRPEVFLVKDI